MILANDDTYGQIAFIFLAVLVAGVAAVSLSLVWAWRAGRGSKPALGGLICAGGLEGFFLFFAIQVEPWPSLALISLAALAAQVALYSRARSKRGASQ